MTRKHIEKIKFYKCEICAKKAGSPELCTPCWQRRNMTEVINEHTDAWNSLEEKEECTCKRCSPFKEAGEKGGDKLTPPFETWEKKIQQDLDDGKFGMICSNEDTFKRYVFTLLLTAKAEERKWIKGVVGKLFEKIDINGGRTLYEAGYKEALSDILTAIK